MGHHPIQRPMEGCVIVPVVGNTDREFWIGPLYFGFHYDVPSIGNWWGYYGDWKQMKGDTEPFLHGREKYEDFADPWTGEWK